MTKPDQLQTLFHRTTGKPAAKWFGYLQHYDRHFSSLKDRPLRLLEIGVQAGGSLEVWAEYFRQATVIIGCDIDPACGDLQYTDPRIKVLIGDVNTLETLDALSEITDTLDLVIDDGSHQSGDIVRSFVQLFPRLTDDGIYLIEDLHCSYWESYGGGLYDPFSAISFFKKIVDIINQSVWGINVDPSDFFAEFQTILKLQDNADFLKVLKDIHSIEFVNSMCVIYKKPAQSNVLGPLVLSGDPVALARSPHQYHAGEMLVPDQTGNVLSQRPDGQNQGLIQLRLAQEEIVRLKEEVISLTTKYYESTKKFYDASVSIQLLELKIKQLEQSKQDAK